MFARSNTYRVFHQMYLEMGAFGTAVSIVLPDFKNVLHHYPVVCGQYALQTNYKGEVVSLYREFQKTVGETVKEFGIKNCSHSVRDRWLSRELESPVHILHVIEPREDQERDPDSPLATDMAYKSCYLELGGDDDVLLRESGFERFPVLAPRWVVSGSDVYASSCPGMETHGDNKQLQHQQLRKGQALDYKVMPPLQVPTELKNRDSEMNPGGMVYADPGTTIPFNQTTTGGGIRAAFEVGLDIRDLKEDMEEVRGRIRSGFHADLFLMLHNIDRTQMTAAEIGERHEEKLLALGPVLERVDNEMLQPMVDIGFDMMAAAGLLPEAPEELQGVELTVEFVSILAQAQQAVGTNAVDRFVANLTAVAELKPDVLDNFNADEWARDYGQMVGVNTKLLVSEENVAALREARAAAQAEQAQLESQQMQAASAKDMASVKTDERNPVADALNAAEVA